MVSPVTEGVDNVLGVYKTVSDKRLAEEAGLRAERQIQQDQERLDDDKQTSKVRRELWEIQKQAESDALQRAKDLHPSYVTIAEEEAKRAKFDNIKDANEQRAAYLDYSRKTARPVRDVLTVAEANAGNDSAQKTAAASLQYYLNDTKTNVVTNQFFGRAEIGGVNAPMIKYKVQPLGNGEFAVTWENPATGKRQGFQGSARDIGIQFDGILGGQSSQYLAEQGRDGEAINAKGLRDRGLTSIAGGSQTPAAANAAVEQSNAGTAGTAFQSAASNISKQIAADPKRFAALGNTPDEVQGKLLERATFLMSQPKIKEQLKKSGLVSAEAIDNFNAGDPNDLLLGIANAYRGVDPNAPGQDPFILAEGGVLRSSTIDAMLEGKAMGGADLSRLNFSDDWGPGRIMAGLTKIFTGDAGPQIAIKSAEQAEERAENVSAASQKRRLQSMRDRQY